MIEVLNWFSDHWIFVCSLVVLIHTLPRMFVAFLTAAAIRR